jgi:hypothetical protein
MISRICTSSLRSSANALCFGPEYRVRLQVVLQHSGRGRATWSRCMELARRSPTRAEATKGLSRTFSPVSGSCHAAAQPKHPRLVIRARAADSSLALRMTITGETGQTFVDTPPAPVSPSTAGHPEWLDSPASGASALEPGKSHRLGQMTPAQLRALGTIQHRAAR